MKSAFNSVLKSVPELKLIPYLAASTVLVVGMFSLLIAGHTRTKVEVPAGTPCAVGAKLQSYSSVEELLVSKCRDAWM